MILISKVTVCLDEPTGLSFNYFCKDLKEYFTTVALDVSI